MPNFVDLQRAWWGTSGHTHMAEMQFPTNQLTQQQPDLITWRGVAEKKSACSARLNHKAASKLYSPYLIVVLYIQLMVFQSVDLDKPDARTQRCKIGSVLHIIDVTDTQISTLKDRRLCWPGSYDTRAAACWVGTQQSVRNVGQRTCSGNTLLKCVSPSKVLGFLRMCCHRKLSQRESMPARVSVQIRALNEVSSFADICAWFSHLGLLQDHAWLGWIR